jgi:hypothetical protein
MVIAQMAPDFPINVFIKHCFFHFCLLLMKLPEASCMASIVILDLPAPDSIRGQAFAGMTNRRILLGFTLQSVATGSPKDP